MHHVDFKRVLLTSYWCIVLPYRQYGFLVQHMLPKEPLVQPDTAQASGDLAQSNLLLAATRDILEG